MDVYKHPAIKKEYVQGRVTLSHQELDRFRVLKGDVFFTRTSETPEEVGMSATLLEDIPNCSFSGFVLRARPLTDLLIPEYCVYAFTAKEIRASIIKNCTYTTRALTNGRVLASLKLPIPSLPEQQRIASALSDADALVAELDALIEKKRAIMAGTMQELLTGKRRLKGFDEPWVKTTLEEIGVFSKGKGIARSEANTGGIPAIRYGEIYTTHHNYIKSYGSFVSDEVAIASRKIKKGDILFTASGETKEDIGKSVAFVSSENACAGGDIIILSPTQKVDSLFLGFLTNASYIQKQKTVKGQGDAVVHITTNSLKSIELSLPSFAEQRAIAFILSDMDAEIAELEVKRDKYKEVRQGMMQQLLTGKIRLI